MHETQASEGRTGVSACLDLRPSSVSPLLTTALSVVGFILRVIYIWSLATRLTPQCMCFLGQLGQVTSNQWYKTTEKSHNSRSQRYEIKVSAGLVLLEAF